MPQAKRQVELNNFSGGFNTEQSPLNADPSTTVFERNMVLASDGSRARRFGYEAETGGETIDLGGISYLESNILPLYNLTSKRVAVANADSFNNNYFLIKNRVDSVVARSSLTTAISESTAVPNILALGGTGYDVDFSDKAVFTTGSYITSGGVGADVVAIYAAEEDNINVLKSYQTGIYVRDLYGVDDGLAISERPVTLDEEHAYNLLNQGWTPEAIDKFNTEVSAFPSNGDVPYFGLTTDGTAPAVYKYDPDRLKQRPFPNGAPKGNFFLYTPTGRRSRSISVVPFFTELNTLLGTSLDPANLTGAGDTSQNYYVKDVEGFLGRVFYVYGNYSNVVESSQDALSLHNAVTFSRVVDSSFVGIDFINSLRLNTSLDNTAVNCTSSLNPTSEDFSPSSSDGGIFFIDGAEKVLGVFSTRQSLIIVASNGIWEVVPQDGFSPQTFVINKILSTVIQDTRGIISMEGHLLVPTATGIYSLSYDGNVRRSMMTPISDKRIRTWYTKNYRKIFDGVWDEARQEARWLLRTLPTESDDGDVIDVEQSELILDLRNGAFTTNYFPTTSAEVAFGSPNFVSRPTYVRSFPASNPPFIVGYAKMEYPLISSDDISTPVDVKREQHQVKLIYADPTGASLAYTAADQASRTFADWSTSFDSIMVTAPMTLGDTIRRKDINYLWTHFTRTEDGFEDDGTGDWIPTNPSGCLMSVRWDFSDDASSGKWSTPSQVYRLQRDYIPEDINDPFTYGQSIITTKNQVRGHGKAISVVFSSDGDKDMQLLGWGTELGIVGEV